MSSKLYENVKIIDPSILKQKLNCQLVKYSGIKFKNCQSTFKVAYFIPYCSVYSVYSS